MLRKARIRTASSALLQRVNRVYEGEGGRGRREREEGEGGRRGRKEEEGEGGVGGRRVNASWRMSRKARIRTALSVLLQRVKRVWEGRGEEEGEGGRRNIPGNKKKKRTFKNFFAGSGNGPK
jgi:hypothetical protein